MEKTLIFHSADEVKFGKLLKFIIPTYLTSLFNTVYTMVDGIFVSSYVGTNALAAINIVYPIVNVLTGIALAFATGGSAIAALRIGAGKQEEANRIFSVSMLASIGIGCLLSVLIWMNLSSWLGLLGATALTMVDCKIYAFWWLIGTPVVIGKELFTYFIRIDGSPTYSFLTALSGGILNILLDYIFVGCLKMGILGAALATILGLLLSFCMGIYYFLKKKKILCFKLRGLSVWCGLRCMVNGASEFVNQLAIAITTVFFNRTAMTFAGEDGIAAVSIIMYLQFLFIGVYFGFSMGMAPPMSYAYGDQKFDICHILETYAYRFFAIASVVIYGLTFLLAPLGVSFFAQTGSTVYDLAVWGMRLYGLGFLCSGLNIFAAIRMMAYGKGYFSGMITFLRSFALLLLFLTVLPKYLGMNGIWLAVPGAEVCTFFVALASLFLIGKRRG
ncbi:MAG: MATE family efflux transporter [Massiliimalia sp.]|jgi:Na+-driven multidrug efflux pump